MVTNEIAVNGISFLPGYFDEITQLVIKIITITRFYHS